MLLLLSQVLHQLNISSKFFLKSSLPYWYVAATLHNLIDPLQNIKEKLGKQLMWQRNQLGHNIRCQNILADRGYHSNNVSNFLQYITYKFINALTSETQVALVDSNPIIYNYHYSWWFIISISWLSFMTIWSVQKMYSKMNSTLGANTHHVSFFPGTHTKSKVQKYVWAWHCVPRRLYFQKLSFLRNHADQYSDVIGCLFWGFFFFLRTHAKLFKVFFGIFVVYHQLLSDSRPE